MIVDIESLDHRLVLVLGRYYRSVGSLRGQPPEDEAAVLAALERLREHGFAVEHWAGWAASPSTFSFTRSWLGDDRVSITREVR